MNSARFFYFFLTTLGLVPSGVSAQENVVYTAQETEVQFIELAPPLNDPIAEFSGMTWCDDKLILIPQYPKRLVQKYSNTGTSYMYSIDKQAILDYLDGKNTEPLVGKPIKLLEKTLRARTLVFDGYEAGACEGNTFWFTVEAVDLLHNYKSYLVRAAITEDKGQTTVSIEPDYLVKLGSQSNMRNKGDEAMLLWQQQAITFHEVNDPRAIDTPKAQAFDQNAQAKPSLPFPHLPFRLTDTTSPDRDGKFWGINYKYSGDKFSRKSKDPLAEKYGLGESQQKYYNRERLVEFQITESGIELVERAPIQLKMVQKEGRNWEGLARLDQRGLLLITDKHPDTLFGFVPFNQQ